MPFGRIEQTDFLVSSKSNAELQEIASRMAIANGLRGAKAIDIIACLTSGWIVTIDALFTRKRLIVELPSDDEMGFDDGLTSVEKDKVIMRFKKSVWVKAEKGDGRARFTLTHEYSHGVLNHKKTAMARATGVSVAANRPVFIPKYQSGETQANFVASATLVDKKLLSEGDTIESIARDFGVSFEFATIVANDIAAKKKSPIVQNGLRQLLDALSGKANFPTVIQPTFIDKFEITSNNNEMITCTNCSRRKACWIGGNQYRCEGCGYVGNMHQDGDEICEF